MLKTWKFWKKALIGISTMFILAFAGAVIVLNWHQDKVIQNVVSALNEDFRGSLALGETDISPFANFPLVSVVIENALVFEDKSGLTPPIVEIKRLELAFNIVAVLRGIRKINLVKVEEGSLNIVYYTDGSNNLANALSGLEKKEKADKTLDFEVRKIQLSDVDLINYDESSRVLVHTLLERANATFRSSEEELQIELNAESTASVINDGDSTFLRNKFVGVATALALNNETGLLTIQPSEVKFRNGAFGFKGSIEMKNELNTDIEVYGNYPNFNLLIGFAPEELIPVLEQYDNAGRIYFEATVKGEAGGGHNPKIDATFGCDSAYFSNPVFNKTLEQIAFSGQFTNGAQRNASTMEFVLENVSAKPESGIFEANLSVKNFKTPEIDMSLRSDFDLDFLAKFLNVTSLEDLDGDVSVKMNFKDIIDLQNPERSLEEFSQSYYSELKVEDLRFRLPGNPLQFDSIDIKASMQGNRAGIDYIYMNVGRSDISVRGDIDDLPGIIHQTADTIHADLFIYSSLLDLKELSSLNPNATSQADEVINNMRLELAFSTTGKDLLSSPNFPRGDFYIKNFYGKLENYPHTLKKFDAHILVNDEDLDIREFTGNIDQSEFLSYGVLYNYPMLLEDTLRGDLEFDFGLKSDLLRLNDLFSYKGRNYVPEDYRKEQIRDLVMYGNAELEFDDSLRSTTVYFDQLSADAIIHDMEIRDIHGKIQLFDDFIVLDQLSGNLGRTRLTANMKLYRGENDSIRKASNRIALYAPMVDYDQLTNYASNGSAGNAKGIDADSVFNIYTLPFTDLKFELDIEEFNYHDHPVENVNADIRIQKNHFLIVDTLRFYISEGFFDIAGTFDGSNPDSIVFYPRIGVQGVDMNQMLAIFDNFGQEYVLAENLYGTLSGRLRGRIYVQPNMIPVIDKSQMQLQLQIVHGELRNYKPFNALSDYFRDKNLARVRFDTLSNELYLSEGAIAIPNMTINSSLGFMDISGTQDLDSHMEYYIRVPLKIVTRAATQKLFGKKNAEIDSTRIDAIQVKNENKKSWYVNLKLEGTPENYHVSLEKKKG